MSSTGHPLLDEFGSMLHSTAAKYASVTKGRMAYRDAWNHLAVSLLHSAGELKMTAFPNYDKLMEWRQRPEGPNAFLLNSLKFSIRREMQRRQNHFSGTDAETGTIPPPLPLSTPLNLGYENTLTLGSMLTESRQAPPPSPEPTTWLEEMRVKYPTLVAWAEHDCNDTTLSLVLNEPKARVAQRRYRELQKARLEMNAVLA